MRNAILFTFLVAAAGSAQWLEEVVVYGWPEEAHAFTAVWNATSNKVYVANYSANKVAVIDGNTNAVLDSIDVGIDPLAFCSNDSNGKVYVANAGASVDVLDCTSDSVVARIGTSLRPQAGCWHPGLNKVYVACMQSRNLFALDGAGDSVLAAVEIDSVGRDMACNLTHDKVYVSSRAWNSVTIVDCIADTVLRTLRGIPEPDALVWNPASGDVWVGARDTVYVIDGETDEIAARIPSAERPFFACVNETDNKVYFNGRNPDGVSVFDGATRQFITRLDIPSECELLWTSTNNKVYVPQFPDTVTVLDGTNDSVLTRIDGVPHMADWWFGRICWNPVRNRVYLGCGFKYPNAVAILRDSMPVGVEEEDEGGRTKAGLRFPTIMRAPGLARFDGRLLDIQGRDVTDRRHSLAPGVYFLRSAGGDERSVVHKVVIH